MPTLRAAREAGLGSLADTDRWMGSRDKKTLAPNTVVHRRSFGGFWLTLYDNTIATFLPDDSVNLLFWRWRTETTKSRLNIVRGVHVTHSRRDDVWWVNGAKYWPSHRACWIDEPFVAFRCDFSPYRTEAVCGIARVIQEEGRADLSPVLADALDDAGCPHQRVQDVLRSAQPNDVVQKILGGFP